MRYTVILIAITLVSISLSAQTYQPSEHKLNYFGNPVFLDEQSDLQQNGFWFQFHWANGYKMCSALGMNASHVNSEVAAYLHGPLKYLDPDNPDALNPRTAENVSMIMNTPYIGHHFSEWNISKNIAYEFEPTYIVPEKPTLNFIPRQYDTTRYAFGFKTVHGFIDNTQNAENYNRLQLFDNDSIRNTVVLSEPWRCDEYFTMIKCEVDVPHDIINDDTIYNIYNKPEPSNYDFWKKNILPVSEKLSPTDWKGVNFYFNINLRRLDDNDIAENNDTILEIKLPYITGGTTPTTGCIMFSMIPDVNYTDTTHLSFGRGIVRNMHSHKGDTVLYITRNMIPKGNESERDITISALFICDNLRDDPDYHNRPLKGFPYTYPYQQIYSIKTEVKYRGGCSLGVDWLSINTKPSRELSFGNFDTTIVNKIQECLNKVTTTKFTSRGMKPFRWYLKDEPSTIYWYTRHYMTKLCGNIFTFEGGESIPQLKYYCDMKESWVGQGGLPAWRCFPYVRRVWYNGSDPLYTNLGISFGYDISYDTNITQAQRMINMKNSNYETVYKDTLLKTDARFNYLLQNSINPLKYGGYCHGFLLGLDYMDYKDTYNDSTNNFLYDPDGWWGQIWNDMRFDLNVNKKSSIIKTSLGRIMTGEEFRYFSGKILLHGAKGFVMDGETETNNYPPDEYGNKVTCDNPINLHHGQAFVDTKGYNNDDDWTFLDREEIGGDYLNLTDPNERFDDFLEMDMLAKYLCIDKNRFYVGRKTVRREFKKFSMLVKACETEIMRMKFVAGLLKGFQRHYIQDPSLGADTVLYNFVEARDFSVLTRPLNRVTDSGQPFYENTGLDEVDGSRIDSALYCLTLLKDNNDPNMDTSFYLGIINRRTGCHIILDSADCGKRDSVAFMATAELEDSARTNPTKWLKYITKRLGCREIRIPLNYLSPIDSNAYCNIRFTELGKGTSLDNNWWRQEPYTKLIDTVLGQVDTLVLRMASGEGKLIRAKIIKIRTIGNSNHVDVCDSIQKITLTVAASDDSCCWNLRYKNDSKIPFTNIPIGFSFPYNIDDSNISFESNGNGSLKRYHNKGRKMFVQTIDTLSRNESGILATVCLVPGTHFNYTYTVGGLVDKTYCKKESSGAMSCPVSDSLCCADPPLNMSVVDVTCGLTPNQGGYIYQPCRYNISFDSPYDSCYYDIAVRQEHSYGSDVELDSLNEINVLLSDYDKEMCDPFDVKSSFKYSRRNIIDTVCLKFYIISGGDTVYVKDSCRINYSQIDLYRPDELYNENIYACDTICIGEPYAGKKENSAGESMSRQLSMTAVPNPFSNNTVIHYCLPEASPVTFELYNSLGIKVMQINDIIKPEGDNSFTFDGNTLPSGIYFFRLVTDNESAVLPLKLIK